MKTMKDDETMKVERIGSHGHGLGFHGAPARGCETMDRVGEAGWAQLVNRLYPIHTDPTDGNTHTFVMGIRIPRMETYMFT